MPCSEDSSQASRRNARHSTSRSSSTGSSPPTSYEVRPPSIVSRAYPPADLRRPSIHRLAPSVSPTPHAERKREQNILNTHAASLSPAVAACEAHLKCAIEGIDRDKILVRFTHLDPADLAREFSLVLDVAASVYKGVSCLFLPDLFYPHPTYLRLATPLGLSFYVLQRATNVRPTHSTNHNTIPTNAPDPSRPTERIARRVRFHPARP